MSTGSIGENIKKRRKQLGMNAETLAEKVNMSPSTIYRYESGGIGKVATEILLSIAEALDTTPTALMGRDEDSPVKSIGFGDGSSYLNRNTPDVEAAALKATETLIKYHVTSAPVLPISILQSMPNVTVMTFTEMADETGLDSNRMVKMFGAETQDVITYSGDGEYFVTLNQRLPHYMLQRAMAREMGRILLRHDTSSKPDNVKMNEALYFSRYLLCPRALLQSLFDNNIAVSVETLGNITGLYGRSLAGIRETPGAHIPAEMNLQIREQFSEYVHRFIRYKPGIVTDNTIPLADFGTYMDNYTEG